MSENIEQLMLGMGQAARAAGAELARASEEQKNRALHAAAAAIENAAAELFNIFRH